MKPMQQTPKEPTPEEQRWRANAEDPARVKRHLKAQYILFGVWCALTIGCGVSQPHAKFLHSNGLAFSSCLPDS